MTVSPLRRTDSDNRNIMTSRLGILSKIRDLHIYVPGRTIGNAHIVFTERAVIHCNVFVYER